MYLSLRDRIMMKCLTLVSERHSTIEARFTTEKAMPVQDLQNKDISAYASTQRKLR